MIEEILQVLPQTKQVFMVIGSGPFASSGAASSRRIQAIYDRLTFIWSDDLSVAEILRRSASLPADSAIFYFMFGTDAAGAAYADERVFAELHAAANAPLLAAQSVYMGMGIVGGSLLSIADLGRDRADVAVRLLNGAPPSSLRVPPRRGATDLRLARAAAMGHPREPVAAR